MLKKQWLRKGQGEVNYYVIDLGKRFVEIVKMFLGEKVTGKVKKVRVR